MFLCPACGAALTDIGSRTDIRCEACETVFKPLHDFACLLTPGATWEGFDEEAGFVGHEAVGTVARISRYFVPTLRSLGATSVLSIGCGDGADVAELTAAGFDAYGFDIPYRARAWSDQGRDPNRVFVADGRRIPVADGSFDIAIALGVLEHVGAIGTSAELDSDWEAQRIGFIRETTRVLKPGGSLILAAPNGAFPIDMQHNVSRTRLFNALGGRTGVSFHPPSIDFLPSYRRLRKWAAAANPALEVSAMPLAGYLGLSFHHSPALRPLANVIGAYFSRLDNASDRLRESGLNPYLVARLRLPLSP